MEHRLSAVHVGIHHDAIPALRDPDLSRHVAREAEQLPDEARIFRLVERGHVMGRNHEEVTGRLRVQIPERQHAFAALHDRRRDLAGGDFAKNARTRHTPPPPMSYPPSAWRSCSQNFFPACPSEGGLLSTLANCSSRARCSAVSVTGVQTWTPTCRSPRPASPTRGSPLPRRRYTAPVCVPGWISRVALP